MSNVITVEEKYNGRNLSRGSGASATVEYIIQGTDDDSAALTALLAYAPVVWDTVLPQQNSSVEQLTQTIWVGTVKYGYQQTQVNEAVYQFDTAGGTQHITQSLSTSQSYAPSGKTAPNFSGAIGVDANSVNGVDITVPTYAFSQTHYFADSLVTDAYKAILFGLTGKTNIAPWRNYNAGEVLFLGVSGARRGYGDWELSFKFAASPNITGKTIGTITGIAKKGWEYLWVRYEDTDDATAKQLIKTPSAVYIEKVYLDGDFGGLGIS
jgi:hypothetical protein